MTFRIVRIYEAASEEGRRVLVDRLWPRGVSKADARLDLWLKDAAPSTELRKWYGHQVDRFDEFADRYRAELSDPPAAGAVEDLIAMSSKGEVLLLTATRDVAHSGARVLFDHLISQQGT